MKQNEYQKMISVAVFDKIPKTVFAAMVVSFLLNNLGKDESEIDAAIMEEWGILFSNGIVPQKPFNIK